MLTTVLLGAFLRLPPMDPRIRDFAMLAAGVTMGAAVTPEALASMAKFPLSLLLLALAIGAIMMASTLVLVRVVRWPLRDAFFASAPGALSAILLIAADVRADVARIALLQTCRIFVLVAVLPSIIAAIEPAAPPPEAVAPPVTALGLAVLFAGGLAGAALFHVLRVPGR